MRDKLAKRYKLRVVGFVKDVSVEKDNNYLLLGFLTNFCAFYLVTGNG